MDLMLSGIVSSRSEARLLLHGTCLGRCEGTDVSNAYGNKQKEEPKTQEG